MEELLLFGCVTLQIAVDMGFEFWRVDDLNIVQQSCYKAADTVQIGNIGFEYPAVIALAARRYKFLGERVLLE